LKDLIDDLKKQKSPKANEKWMNYSKTRPDKISLFAEPIMKPAKVGALPQTTKVRKVPELISMKTQPLRKQQTNLSSEERGGLHKTSKTMIEEPPI
jgi:hypothetical protein